MVGVEHLLSEAEVVADLGALLPGNAEQPIQVVAHDRGFRRHRAHLPDLLQLVVGLLAGLLGQPRLGDALFQFAHLVAAVLAVAEFLLDRLHLLVEVVLALRLLHLALDARADALLHLQHGDLALHHAEHLLQALRDGGERQDLLLLRDADRQVRGDVSASLEVSSMLVTAERTSGLTFLLSFT
jgi:hypothetical protein